MELRFASRLGTSLFPLVVSAGLLAGCSSAPESTENLGESSADLSANALSAAENTAYAFFVNKGLTPAQSAGIVGNLMQESNVLATAVQPGGPGRGIAQWSVGARWNESKSDNVEWYAAKEGLSATSLTLQLEFVWYELSTFSGFGLASLKKTTDVTNATIIFERDYEGCGTCDQSNRIAYAKQVLAGHGSTGGSGGGGTECYSGTLGREVANNTCVESRADKDWYQCDNGNWVLRASDPEACSATYPL